jgi:type II secretory pathway component GspD/PulD (secretin)
VPLVDLRVIVDDRTNSIIAAGSDNDLLVIESIISQMDTIVEVVPRKLQAFRLRNAQAVDLANIINTFLTQEIAVYTAAGQMPPFQAYQRNVIIVAEPITNTLLLGATQDYFEKVMQLIAQVDALPPQVVIQALIAEVLLSGTEEFGVELGFQSPIFFDRGLVAGTTVNQSVPGFNFNTTSPLPNANGANARTVALQGLGNLGVNRFSPTSGVGGFIFSAASESVSVLVRALRTQNRLDVLSRPQLMTADNQAARILVGQNFPYVTASVVTTGVTGIPAVTNTVDYRDVGVSLQVTPKINPDGSVIMRVIPEVSSPAQTTVDLGNGVFATAFNVQTVETTVIAHDGETVVLGGLITRRDDKQERKIPWFGDLPGVGALFRFRGHAKEKRELLVILTPHIVRSMWDAEMVFAEEHKRMDWVVGDVLKLHGTSGMHPMMSPPPGPGPAMGFGQGGHIWPNPGFTPNPETAPAPRSVGPPPYAPPTNFGVPPVQPPMPQLQTPAPPLQPVPRTSLPPAGPAMPAGGPVIHTMTASPVTYQPEQPVQLPQLNVQGTTFATHGGMTPPATQFANPATAAPVHHLTVPQTQAMPASSGVPIHHLNGPRR